MIKVFVSLLMIVFLLSALAACTVEIESLEANCEQTTTMPEIEPPVPNPPWFYSLGLEMDEFFGEHGCGIRFVGVVECEDTKQLLLVISFCPSSRHNYFIRTLNEGEIQRGMLDEINVLDKTYRFEIDMAPMFHSVLQFGGNTYFEGEVYELLHVPEELESQIFFQWVTTSTHSHSLIIGSNLPVRVEERIERNNTTTPIRNVIPIVVGE